MAIMFNTTEETQSIKIYGNWFTFAPGKIKMVDDKLARGIAMDKKEYGVVLLPEEFSDPEYKDTEAGKTALTEKRAEGLSSYLSHLRWIVMNNQVSLRRDLEQKNIKADPSLYASKGEMDAVELLAKYQSNAVDETKVKADRFKELVKQSGGDRS